MDVLNMRDYTKRKLPPVAHLDALARQSESAGLRRVHAARVLAARRGEYMEPEPAEPFIRWTFWVLCGCAAFIVAAWITL